MGYKATDDDEQAPSALQTQQSAMTEHVANDFVSIVDDESKAGPPEEPEDGEVKVTILTLDSDAQSSPPEAEQGSNDSSVFNEFNGCLPATDERTEPPAHQENNSDEKLLRSDS